MPNDLFVSVLVLLASSLALLYVVFAFAHVRVCDGDLSELDRLRQEGILPLQSTSIADFQLVRARLNEIAPAVCMRQEVWLAMYFQILRAIHGVHRTAATVEVELQRLSAYQAGNYRIALNRLEAIRNPNY